MKALVISSWFIAYSPKYKIRDINSTGLKPIDSIEKEIRIKRKKRLFSHYLD
ncbi:MAG: hypothetical protein ACTSRZ_08635 [Promethearchaeota archaeon]